MYKSFLALGLLLLFLSSCNSNQEEKVEEKPTFKVSSYIQKDTLINKEYIGQIRAHQRIELRSMEKGYLTNIYVDEGQRVGKGQLLFTIQPNIYQAETSSAQARSKSAKAEVEFARVEYNNAKALADKGIISPTEETLAKAKLQKAEAEYNESNAELNIAQTHLNFTQIRAPFSGIIGKFEEVRLGSLMDEGELLTTLTDNSKMWVYFNVPETEYLDYSMNPEKETEKVQLQLANAQIFPEEGTIETIESDFDNTTGNIAFRATFPNPKQLLRHGQTGTVLWPKEIKNAIMIPQRATYEVLEKKYVFVVDKEGKVHSQEVHVIGELDHIYIIDKGLKSTDRFLIEGLRKVKNGEEVETKFEAPEKIFSDLELHAE